MLKLGRFCIISQIEQFYIKLRNGVYVKKVGDDFGHIRKELSELADTEREVLDDANLAKKLGDLARRVDRLRREREIAAADRERQESGEIYDEFGNAIIVFLKAYKGNPVIWSVIDSYMERNPEVFGLRYRAGFNRWTEQAENDQTLSIITILTRELNRGRGGQLAKMVQLAMR